MLTRLPVAGIGLDLVRGERNLELIRDHGFPQDKTLFAGVVSGRNVWINDLARSIALVRELRGQAGDDVVVSTSCSLQHSPIDKRNEPRLDDEVLSWMSFAVQKLDEVATIARALNEGEDAVLGHARSQPEGTRRPRALAAYPQPGGARARGRDHRGRLAPAEPVPGAPSGAAPEAWAAAVPDHDDRLVPADGRDPPGPLEAARRRHRRGQVPGADARRDRARDPAPGGHRPRRAGARGAGAERHGPVLRGADGWLRVHRERVGAELRLALCPAADPLRGRLASERDDGRVGEVRAVAERPAREGHAHRPGDDAHVVVRARRSAALADLRAAGARDPRRDRGPRGRGRRDHPGRRAGDPRGPAPAARPLGRVPGLGGATASACRSPRSRTRPRSRRTCVTRSSATSCGRSRRWTPTSC